MQYKKLVGMSIFSAAFLGMIFLGGTSLASAEMNISANAELKTDLNRSYDDKGRDWYGDDDHDGKGEDDRGDRSNNQGMVGTVTAVNNSNISVKSNRDGKVYSINTTNSTIIKGQTSMTLGDIKVGDLVIIKGTMTGEMSMSATEIKNPRFTDKYPDNDKDENLKMGIMGTVTAVNNSTLTVTDKNGKVYTVATTNAKFQKDQGTTITIDDIKIGDTVMIQGSINGNNVTATNVFDVQLYTDSWMEKHSMYQGTVTAVNDTTITMKDASGKIYTVTTTDAKFRSTSDGKDGSSTTLSEIRTGDKITVKGDLSGSTIEADTVYDGQLTLDINKTSKRGFFYNFGNFFKKLFGGRNK